MDNSNVRQQHWMFVGNSPGSERAWGVGHIDFPCSYLIPDIAVTESGQSLIWPSTVERCMILSGLAVEISRVCSNIESEAAAGYIAGYRLWSGLHCNFLPEALTEREHTITMWDRGVSVFYGLWLEDTQAFGERLSIDQFNSLQSASVEMTLDNQTVDPSASFKDYHFAATDIIAFLSKFMTLSEGDKLILGPLVHAPLHGDAHKSVITVGDVRMNVDVVRR